MYIDEASLHCFNKPFILFGVLIFLQISYFLLLHCQFLKPEFLFAIVFSHCSFNTEF